MLPADVLDRLDNLRQVGTLLIQLLYLSHIQTYSLHHYTCVLKTLEAFLHPVQLCLYRIPQLGLNGCLGSYIVEVTKCT